MIPTYESALAKAGTATGFGLGKLLGGVSDVLSAPRRALWDQLGLGENGSDLVNRLFEGSVDPNGLGGQLIGNAAEMVLDPINLLGPLAGFAGRTFGKSMDIAKSIGTQKAALAEKLGAMTAEKSALGEVGALAKGALEAPGAIQNWPKPTSPLWSIAEPDLPPLVGLPKIGAQKVYNRASPEAVAALEKSGMGTGLAQQGKRGAVLTIDEKPPFISGRGGSMQVDPTAYIPKYEASFSPPRSPYQMYGGDEAATLAQRLGESADVLHAPMADVGGSVARRIGSIDLDQQMLGEMIANLNAAKPPLGFTPKISEQSMNSLANMHTGGIAAALTPLLFAPPKPLPPRPLSEWEQIQIGQTAEPPLSDLWNGILNPEPIKAMPTRAPIHPPIFNR